MNEIKMKVTGMTCGGCTASVKKAISVLDPAAHVEVDLKTGLVEVHSDKPASDIINRIKSLGYGVSITSV